MKVHIVLADTVAGISIPVAAYSDLNSAVDHSNRLGRDLQGSLNGVFTRIWVHAVECVLPKSAAPDAVDTLKASALTPIREVFKNAKAKELIKDVGEELTKEPTRISFREHVAASAAAAAAAPISKRTGRVKRKYTRRPFSIRSKRNKQQ